MDTFLNTLRTIVKQHPIKFLLMLFYYSPFIGIVLPDIETMFIGESTTLTAIIAASDVLIFLLVNLIFIKSILDKPPLQFSKNDLLGCLTILIFFGISYIIAFFILLPLNLVLVKDGYIPDIILSATPHLIFSVVMGIFFWIPLAIIDEKSIHFKNDFFIFKPLLKFSLLIMLFGMIPHIYSLDIFRGLITFIQIISLISIYLCRSQKT